MADEKKRDENKGFFDKLEEKIFPHERRREAEEEQKRLEAEERLKRREMEQAEEARRAAQEAREKARGEHLRGDSPDTLGTDRAAVPESGVPSTERVHKVVEGETLSHLALKYYGSAARESWMKIYEANKDVIGDNPNMIRVGQELKIP
jgi:nucleoid-associated protein YgaU